MTVDTIYVVYEYRKAPGIIKIEHKDIDTKEDLIEQETRNWNPYMPGSYVS